MIFSACLASREEKVACTAGTGFRISSGFAPLKAADRQGVKLTWSSAGFTTAVSA